MSRHVIESPAGKWVYGFDEPLGEYFLQEQVNDEIGFKEIVGSLGDQYGSAAALLEAVDELGLELPMEHRALIEMDLPV